MLAHLPIEAHKAKIIEAVTANQVVIIEGETGSGKTTQIPLYLFECEEITSRGMIGITEPRRVAATSVAKYVAEQLGCELGEEVAYQIRFDSRITDKTMVKFMTDGILLREIQLDNSLSRYSAIIVDEAHERSENIDLTLGLLKEILKVRPDLKVIVTSATIDTSKFSEFFDGAPVISIPGRCYPVEVIYHPVPWGTRRDGMQYAEEAADVVRMIHENYGEGDILVFMSGMDDITVTVNELEAMNLADLNVLIAHGDMAFEDQQKIFEDTPGVRKVVIGTNIIETGITVDGVKYCVDSGYIKQTDFDPERGLASLTRVQHSKAGCDQRKGRAGRTQPGICWRLYDQRNYDDRNEYTKPEILRTELSDLVLSMKSIGIHDVENFDFVDNPGREAIHAAYVTLVKLGALLENNGLTETGRLMAKLPVEPRSARMIVEAEKRGCVDEVLTVVAFRSLRSPFARPKGKEREADMAKMRFRVETSDYLTWLKVMDQYKANGEDWGWAKSNFLKSRVLSEVVDIRKQLMRILKGAGIEITSNPDSVEIAKCVAAGLVENICQKRGGWGYEYSSGERSLYVFPGSALMGTEPEWFVCNQLRSNNQRKTYGIDCQVIKPEWLIEVAPQLCTIELIDESLAKEELSGTFYAKGKVTFEGHGEICDQEMTFAPAHPRYEEINLRYQGEVAWRGFLENRPERQFFPHDESDFVPGNPEIVFCHPGNGNGEVVIMAYEYVRTEGILDGKRYYRGYSRDERKAMSDTSHARSMWSIGRYRNYGSGYGNGSFGYRSAGY